MKAIAIKKDCKNSAVATGEFKFELKKIDAQKLELQKTPVSLEKAPIAIEKAPATLKKVPAAIEKAPAANKELKKAE